MDRRHLILLAALLPLLFAFRPGLVAGGGPQTSSGVGGGGGGSVLTNDPTKNIFDTYDPLCDGTNADIMFCDGHEDAEWIVNSAGEGTAGTDYYFFTAFSPDPNDTQGGTNFTECGGTNPNRAEFGAFGTPCTATKGWVTRPQDDDNVPVSSESPGGLMDGSHRMDVDGSPTTTGPGSDHFGLRVMLKFAGDTSTRCPSPGGGDNPCSAVPWKLKGTNGFKAIEFANGPSFGLGNPILLQTWDGAEPITLGAERQMFGFTTAGASCGVDDIYVGQDTIAADFDHRSFLDQWIMLEIDVLAQDPGHVRLYMDACGRDGLSCPETQTLVAENVGADFASSCGNANWLWVNFWARGQDGEIQWDEMVVRDRSLNDTLIGRAPLYVP